MKNKKIRVAVLFGGKSAEHEVSIQSAKNVVASLDKNKYDVSLIGIDKKGSWHRVSEQYLLESSSQQQMITAATSSLSTQEKQGLVTVSSNNLLEKIDVVFPILHGPYGEDGSMQGLLKLAEVPFVGSGVLGSAVGMDKDMMKRLLQQAGLPVAKFLVFRQTETVSFTIVTKQLGLPLFVKPANLGSSIGVSKVTSEKEFRTAVAQAFTYDSKILVEEAIAGREIECSVLGNTKPIASLPGEIVASHSFYNYTAKYLDEKGAVLTIPAVISKKQIQEVQQLSIDVFRTLGLEGMARIDFFLTPKGKWYVNEANTIPGFTNISMYPKLWEASGVSNIELVDRLIALALGRHGILRKLKSSL